MDRHFMEEMKCPICLEIPSAEIFQCINGHSLCSSCLDQVSVCPQCREDLETGKIRNRTLERLLDIATFDCSNKSNGCEAKLIRQDIQDHQKDCIYSGVTVKLCQLLGFSCDFLTRSNAIQESWEHFQYHHKFLISNANEFRIKYQFPSFLSHNQKRLWNPRLIDFNGILLLLVGYMSYEKVFSLICIQFEDDLPKNKFFNAVRVEFTIKALDSESAPDIVLSLQPVPLRHAVISIQSPQISFPLDHLKNHYISGDLSTVDFLITKRNVSERSNTSQENVVSIVRMDAFNEPIKVKSETVDLSNEDSEGMDNLKRLRLELEKTRLK